MATNESRAIEDDALTPKAASGPAAGAAAAWLAIDVVIDPGGWPAGALVAGIAFLPLLGVALRRSAVRVSVAALGAILVLSGTAVIRGGTPSAPLLALLALCGAFLVGFGYALAEP